MKIWIACGLGLLVWVPGLAQEPIRVGEEFQVNSYTTGNQRHPAVTVDSQGDFVVVWQSYGSDGTDSSFWSIQGQRHDANGTPVSGQFQVNSYTTSTQGGTSVAVDPDGDFVVVWNTYGSYGTDSSSWSVQAQRYDAEGTLVGGEFQVNSYTTDGQTGPSIATDAQGNLVVVWRSSGSYGTDSSSWSIQAQRYDAEGTLVDGEFQVNSYTTDGQTGPSIATDAQGNFVVVWRSYGSYGTDSSSWSIQGQRFDSAGTPAGGQFQVNTYTTGSQSGHAVAMDAQGDFVVVWASSGSYGTDTDQTSIQGQRFNADGTPVSGQFQVNSYTTGFQDRGRLAMIENGIFVVVWQSSGWYETDQSTQGQLFNADGTHRGEQFQVNTDNILLHRSPSVAGGPPGDFVVVWHSSRYAYPYGHYDLNIKAQRFTIGLFYDGFESGDTSAWSSSVP